MPKQQRGAGLLDFMVSDPKKRMEMNNQKIEELKKESETKCGEIQKANDAKIKKLEDDNVKLQEQVDAKANEGPSIMSRFKNLFSSSSQAEEAKPKEEDVKAEGDANPMKEEVKKEGENPMGQNPMGQNPIDQNPMGQKPIDQKPIGDRNLFGGKKKNKSKKRKQRFNRRKSSKK